MMRLVDLFTSAPFPDHHQILWWFPNQRFIPDVVNIMKFVPKETWNIMA